LASTIWSPKLLRQSQIIAARTFDFLGSVHTAAVYYWVICLVLSFGQSALNAGWKGMWRDDGPKPCHRESVHKAFGDNEVLEGCSFNVRAGSADHVIGPPVRARRRCLRALNATGRARRGVIQVGDESKSTSPSRSKEQLRRYRAQSGFVFQSHNLFPHKTVLQNVTEGRCRAEAAEG
jgi:hypothetical protein